MFPILAVFQLPYLGWMVQLRAYPTMHVIALLVLVAITLHDYGRDIGPPSRALDPFLAGVPAAMLGAMLLALWTTGSPMRNPLELPIYWQFGSKSAYGGLVTGIAVAALTARWRGLPVRRFLDAGAPGLALAVVFARIGCFLAGCCWGYPTSSALGVRFPDSHDAMIDLPAGATGVHPTQLYLAGAALLTALVLFAIRPRLRPRPGALFETFVVLYATGVFWIEFLRADSGRWFAAGLSHTQWISLASVAGVAIMALRSKRGVRAPLAVRTS